jgi:general secretion pathway protein I
MDMSLVKYCPNFSKRESGLTLIEVLIALAIIGIAMTAVIKATSQNIKSTGYLQNKTIAMWVGREVMNEIRAGLLHIDSSTHNQKLTTDMLGRDWYWQMQEEETPIKRIKKITVTVFANENPDEDDSSLITLESFRYDEE